ncbi:MAG TPA: hypothetical protein VNR88_09035, partial [Hyphomicrobium sp.]|nr:hypothetical protein [Hyphomicrobium sp.]
MRIDVQRAKLGGRVGAGILATLAATLVAACSTGGGGGMGTTPTAALAPAPGLSQGQIRAPVKIALLLPLAGMGETA